MTLLQFLGNILVGHISYYWFLILAVGFIFLEFHLGEGSSLCIGVGFLVAALFSWFGANFSWEIIAFIIASTASFICIRPLTLKYFYKNSAQITPPSEDVLQKTAVVEVDIDPIRNTGRVLVNGESWKATAEKPLKKGVVCVVESLQGVTLVVKEK